MLSILIPEHNYNCTKLVSDLARQCKEAGIVFEIIVMDDNSELCKAENQGISKISGCVFVESDENLGSAKIRNCLASMAQYPNLLMIDCDAEVNDESYIERYLNLIGQSQVVVGGVRYSSERPSSDCCLRWIYGKRRECLPTEVRNKYPYTSLFPFNLMMEKDIILRLPFDEHFKDYGHEDTVFGFSLKQNGIKILHIDNPLIHRGLDSNETFLYKSLKAVEKYVTNPVFQSDELISQIKIFSVFRKVQSIGLCRLFAFKFRFTRKIMEANLCSKYPSLFIFDFYRLSYLCYFFREQQKIVVNSNTLK